MLELINAVQAEPRTPSQDTTVSPVSNHKTSSETLLELDSSLQDIYQALRAYLLLQRPRVATAPEFLND